MPGFAFSIPVVPGKEELDRRTFDEMLVDRREDYEAALRQAGLTRQTIWHQDTPNGTVAVVYVEGDDPEAGIAQFGSSVEPLNTWFREQMKRFTGSTSRKSSFAPRRFTTFNSEKPLRSSGAAEPT